MRIVVPNLLFFGTIAFSGNLFNFTGAQSEILSATFIFGATELQLGIMGAVGAACYALPVMLTGLLSERLGRRPLVLMAILGMGLSYFWGAHTGSMRELYGVVMLRCLSTSMLWPPLMAWMARAVPRRTFPRFLGKYNVSWAVGTFIGFWGAGYLFQNIGWSVPFNTAGGIAMALLVFVLAAEPRGGKGIAPSADSVDSEHDDHGLSSQQVNYYVKQGLLLAGTGAVAGSSALYLFPKIGEETLTELQISLLNSFRLVGQTLMFYMMGRFDLWHFKRWPVWLVVGLLVGGLAILSAGREYYQFIVGCVMIGMGFGTGFSMCAYYALGLSASKGRGSGSMETMIGLGGLTGPLFGGSVASITTARIGILSSALPIAISSWFAMRKDPGKSVSSRP